MEQNKDKVPLVMQHKIQRCVEIESSFLFGFCETITFNLDFVFRWTYMICFTCLMGYQFTKLTGDISIFSSVLLINMFALCVLVTKIIKYRE